MNNALAGFVTGFAGTLAETILTNKKEARDYFNKQVEYARTTGLQNRNKVKGQVETNLSIAKQLEAVGVPKEVIMAQVNQDPQSLEGFYQQTEEIRAKTGKNLSPDQWRSIYKVAGDFKAPDEDLSTFIARTYDPIANAVQSPDFEDDPEGSLISSMMGFNAMDKARAKLGKTPVAEGLTAEQLIQYGDVAPQRQGSATVVTDYTQIPKTAKEEGGGELSIAETTALYKFADEQVNQSIALLQQEGGGQQGEDVTGLRDSLVTEIAKIYPQAPPAEIAKYVNQALANRNFTVDGTAPPQEEQTVPVTSEDLPPPRPTQEEAPQALTTTLEVPDENGQIIKLSLVKDNGDGTSTYRDQTGKDYTLDNDKVRAVNAP